MNSHQRRTARRTKAQQFSNMSKQARSILLPIIRKTTPGLIVNELISVQPMAGPTGMIHTLRTRYSNILNFNIILDHTYDVPNDYCVVEVVPHVAGWIEEQNITLWKPIDTDSYLERYIISDTLYTLMSLRWA
jgi:hypothetical protein